MTYTIVRYTVRPDSEATNQRQVRSVFQELQERKPAGLRYASLSLGEGAFLHVVAQDQHGAPSLGDFSSFQAFQRDVGTRTILDPQLSHAQLVGNYRMLQPAELRTNHQERS